MTLKTNWGNDVLNAYAAQINELEAQGNRTGAPAKYGKDLENWFNQLVKETRDGSGGKSASGSSSAAGGGSTTEGGGKAGSGKAGGSTPGSSTPGSSGGTPGSSSGGTPGSSSGGTSGSSSGGTPGSSGGTPGSSDGTGAIEPPNSLSSSIDTIHHIAGPGAAAAVQGIAQGGAGLAATSAGAVPIEDAIGQAGANAAEHASADGGNASVDAQTGAEMANSAAEFIKSVGGDDVEMADAADAVAEAIKYGGLDAGRAVLDAMATAAAVGGAGSAVEAAEAVAEATKSAARAFGGDLNSVLQVARAVGDQAKFGGAGAHAAANAVEARANTRSPGQFGPEDVSLFKSDASKAGNAVNGAVGGIRAIGGKAQDLADVANFVVKASAFGADIGVAASDAALNSADYASKHTLIGQSGVEGSVRAAENVYDTALAVRQHGGSSNDMSNAVNAVSRSAKLLGPAGADDAAQAFNNAIASGENVHDAVDAPKAVADALGNAKNNNLNQGQRIKLADSVRDASKFGSSTARDVADTFETVMKSGRNKNKAVEAAQDVAESAQDGGAEAADAMAQTAKEGGINAVRDAIKEVRHMKALGASPADVAKMAELFPTAARLGFTDRLTGFAEFPTVQTPQQLYDFASSAIKAYSVAGEAGVNMVIKTMDASNLLGGDIQQRAMAAKAASEEIQWAVESGATPRGAIDLYVNNFKSAVAVGYQSGRNPAAFLNALRTNLFEQTPSAPSVLTADGMPAPIETEGPAINAYNQLNSDLQSGADKSTIQKDAQQLAAIAGGINDPTLQKVALLVGSGFYGNNNNALAFLDDVDPHDTLPLGHKFITDPMNPQDHTPLNDAYLQLETDISNNADKQTIKADAQQVEQLAGSDHPGLAAAAHNISASIDDGSYDQTGSLNALMNNPSNAAAAPPPSSPPPPSNPPSGSPSDESAAYQKLIDDLTKGATGATIEHDALQLAALAIQNGDDHLAQVALDIGDVTKGTRLDIPAMDGIKGLGPAALNDLKSAAPGTPAAQGDA